MTNITDVSEVPIFDDVEDAESDTSAAVVDQKPAVSSTKEWYDMIMHPKFIKALILAMVVILIVSLSPTNVYIKDRVSALDSVPYATEVINAVLSAFIITFLRPPTDTIGKFF